MIVLYAVGGLFILLLIWIAADVVIAVSKRPKPDLPEDYLDAFGLSEVYYYLTEPDKVPNGLIVNEGYIKDRLNPSIKYINKRYDCADFRCQLLFRLYKDFSKKLPECIREDIKRVFLDFKYWMDEPGKDSMCFWSENHQMLFAVSEYLAGQEWPDEIFSNSGITGKEHMAKALRRIHIWTEQRFRYGFFEWHSNNYYAEDLAPMANYIQYSHDKDSVKKVEIALDLLLFDVATHSVNNTFVSASSRMYGDNKCGDLFGNRIRAAMDALASGADTGKLVLTRTALEESILNGQTDLATTVKQIGVNAQMMLNFIAMQKAGCYNLPRAIYNVIKDKTPAVILASSGLNTSELQCEGLIGQDDRAIMAQLGGEAFTNPEVIGNTLKYLSKNKMFHNLFVSPFRFIDIKLFRLFGIPRVLSSRLPLMTNGVALQRGNVYCYRTAYYSLITAIAQNVDACGAQAHIWSLNIAPDLALFTTHPARDDEKKDKHAASPGYWVGNGRQPMSVQDKNVNITIYKIPKKKRPLEFYISDITHAYMPKDKFDVYGFSQNRFIGRRGKVFVSLIGSGTMQYRPYDAYAALLISPEDRNTHNEPPDMAAREFDLVMKSGEYHAYVTEVSDADTESYEHFKARVESNTVKFNGSRVTYSTGDRILEADYNNGLMVNGEKLPIQYRRFDSPYSVTDRNPESIEISCGNSRLFLSIKSMIREER